MKKTQAIVPASTASPQTGETMVVDGCTIKISYAAKSDGQQMDRIRQLLQAAFPTAS